MTDDRTSCSSPGILGYTCDLPAGHPDHHQRVTASDWLRWCHDTDCHAPECDGVVTFSTPLERYQMGIGAQDEDTQPDMTGQGFPYIQAGEAWAYALAQRPVCRWTHEDSGWTAGEADLLEEHTDAQGHDDEAVPGCPLCDELMDSDGVDWAATVSHAGPDQPDWAETEASS